MTPAELLHNIRADRVTLTLAPDGSLKVSGDGEAVKHWTPAIRENRERIIGLLQSPPLSENDRAAVTAYLAMIGETDAAAIAEEMETCRTDGGAGLAYIRWYLAEFSRPTQLPEMGRRE
jgi:hypothetical protein